MPWVILSAIIKEEPWNRWCGGGLVDCRKRRKRKKNAVENTLENIYFFHLYSGYHSSTEWRPHGDCFTGVYSLPSLILKDGQWSSTMCPFVILQNQYWVWLTRMTLKKSFNTEEVTNIFLSMGKKSTQNLVFRLIMMWLKVIKNKVFFFVLTLGSVRIL